MGELHSLTSVTREARALRAAGERCLLVTVVRVRGSAYRRPGARMLLTETRWVAGSISGGCLERDIVKKGWWRTEGCPAVCVTYDARTDEDHEDGFGLGCDGAVDVLIERLDASGHGGANDAVDFVTRCLEAERPGALVTVFRSTRDDVPVGSRWMIAGDDPVTAHSGDTGDGAPRDGDGGAIVEGAFAAIARAALEKGVLDKGTMAPFAIAIDDGRVEALVEVVLPPPHLFVIGTGHDAAPVVALAKSVGFAVTLCDHRARTGVERDLAGPDRRLVLGPGALADAIAARARPLAIVMSHHYDRDKDALGALLSSHARYIGVLGPRTRTDRMLDDLRRAGIAINGDALARLHAPAGLHLGAETPVEIALAIVAEAQATLTGAPAGRLRDQRGPIHVRE